MYFDLPDPIGDPPHPDPREFRVLLDRLPGMDDDKGDARLKAAARIVAPIEFGAGLAGPRCRDGADALAAALHESWPWLAVASSLVWEEMKAHIGAGGAGLFFRPVVLDGPPGIGKTAFARGLARRAGAELRTIDAGQAGAAFRVAGVEWGWRDGAPGVPLEAIARSRTANPVILVDEIDKAGSGWSGNANVANLSTALLGLLEPETARSWECCHTRLRFDMSRVCWILTSNDAGAIPAPLRDRCRVLSLRPPDYGEELAFLRREAAARLGPERAGLLAEAFDRQRRGRPAGLRRIMRILGNAAGGGRDAGLH